MAVLRGRVAALLVGSSLRQALWGVHVVSLASGDTLVDLNPDTLVMPASNMKIVTLAAAAERLGWDYRFTTKLLAVGAVRAGVLRGDLVVVGGGDPTLRVSMDDSEPSAFDQWAAAVKAAGITRVTGRVIGDDRLFESEPIGPGWSWDDLAEDYAAPTGALQLNENAAEVIVQAGAAPGTPARVEVRPSGSGVVVRNRLRTVAADGPTMIEMRRAAGAVTLDAVGLLPAGGPATAHPIAVPNGTTYFVGVLRARLRALGVAVDGRAAAIDPVRPPNLAGAREIAVQSSAPLSEMASRLMKQSQNQYAETLVKTLALQAGARPATLAGGRKIVEEVLLGWGVPWDSYVMVDGSGLSRYNYLTPRMLTTILTRIHKDSRHAAPFAASLPVAGREGTMRNRMKGLRTEGVARAKTGTLFSVRALSGYAPSADGEPLAFSIIANNFNAPSSEVDAVVDRAVEALANFSRKP